MHDPIHTMKKFILTSEASRQLNLTPAGVIAMERRGELPAERTTNGVRLFDAAVVQRIARERARAQERGDEKR